MPTTPPLPRQNTIVRPGEIQGVGLHTGAEVRMRIHPAPVDTGIVFRRTDLPGSPDIPANLAHVVGTDLGTSIGQGEARLHTVEHLLSALVAREIDNAFVEVDGVELPAADGSAREFARMLDGCGLQEQDAPAKYLTVDQTFSLSKDRSEYVVAPAQDYRVSATIEFDHPLIGRQFASFRVADPSFATEVLPARTFGFLRDVEAMRGRGLAMGGSQDNAVVLTEDGVLEGTQLRFPDEFVRHKALDVVGDLALVGARIRGHVIAERPGHLGNVALAKELVARAEKKALARPILNIEQISQYLPHRYPFLLVDRVVEFEERKRIVGLKNVTINEPFFVGHFPGRPVMPGVLIIEAMAQVGGLLVLEQMENLDDKVVYFMSLDNVKWRRPVTPGDQIRFEVVVLQIRGATCRMRGVGTVDGHVVAEAEMMARVVDK
ncbi:MAG TPA: bifunctional UDP-3-O-[3-hydroxymyristoyl] N-acetylglucosamine deacetylase/3-hydroxyacyl-ACP dehydratase [Longimicrobium sp.]|jgi:UDP-3-O-[3-hydroxymyristoyl] N-acetylglucosamine deacetylase/3-hydroxyacyl-[acyl-carrier-protein] dehydratase|uniref:bifunctional UDP-3-O-[3-hydroxymyristoyl] N-acetylglucosamine deacetylase/3-hydroxyacyl-ACP dehydratase n=1 Tax=Longimicrobium sp. TaxID=2029185 RepID=UPI002EDB14A6